MRHKYLIILCLFFGLLTSSTSALSEALRIGSVGSNPNNEIKIFKPFVSYLANNLRSEGITEGKVVVTTSLSQMFPVPGDHS